MCTSTLEESHLSLRDLHRARFRRGGLPAQQEPLVRMLGAEQLQCAVDDVRAVGPPFHGYGKLDGNAICRILDKSLRRGRVRYVMNIQRYEGSRFGAPRFRIIDPECTCHEPVTNYQ